MKIYTIIILSLLIFSLYTPVAFSAPAKPVDLVIFVGEGCPHCAKMKEYINDLKNTDFSNINIIEYEVYHDVDNQNLMDRYAKAYNTTSQYVPLTFIGDNAISGENKNELQRLLTLCQVKSCESPEKIVEKFYQDHPELENIPTTAIDTSNYTTVGWVVIILLFIGFIVFLVFKLPENKK